MDLFGKMMEQGLKGLSLLKLVMKKSKKIILIPQLNHVIYAYLCFRPEGWIIQRAKKIEGKLINRRT